MKVMVGLGQINYLIANGFAIAFCSLANFLASEKWAFQSEAKSLRSRLLLGPNDSILEPCTSGARP